MKPPIEERIFKAHTMDNIRVREMCDEMLLLEHPQVYRHTRVGFIKYISWTVSMHACMLMLEHLQWQDHARQALDPSVKRTVKWMRTLQISQGQGVYICVARVYFHACSMCADTHMHACTTRTAHICTCMRVCVLCVFVFVFVCVCVCVGKQDVTSTAFGSTTTRRSCVRSRKTDGQT